MDLAVIAKVAYLKAIAPPKLETLKHEARWKRRHLIQDWYIFLSQPSGWDNPPRMLKVENITAKDMKKEEKGHAHLVYTKLAKMLPPRLWGPSHFFIQYSLPGAPYAVSVNLNDGAELANTFLKFANIEMDTYLRFGPAMVLRCYETSWLIEKSPRVVLNFRHKVAIIRYLTSAYMSEKITVQELDSAMVLTKAQLQRRLHDTLSPDEQKEHDYLLLKKTKAKSLEKQFMEGTLSMTDFAELKYPELAAHALHHKKTFPLPEKASQCIVCGTGGAYIRCRECHYRVCNTCAETCMSKAPLLFHTTYCIGVGNIHAPLRPPLPPLALNVPEERSTKFLRAKKKLKFTNILGRQETISKGSSGMLANTLSKTSTNNVVLENSASGVEHTVHSAVKDKKKKKKKKVVKMADTSGTIEVGSG